MRQFLLIGGLLFALVLGGTVGIHLLTGHSWLDSSYLALVTLTTVGSRDPAEGPASTIFIMGYLVCGLTVFTYGAFQMGQLIVNANIGRFWERRKMDQRIERLQNHYIVCGMGRMGRTICEYLARRKQPFVAIDNDREQLDAARQLGWLYVLGDATDDDTLIAAGISRAVGLATALPTDADNLYVVLSARMLSPSIQIVARASDDDAVIKMERAGATRVISPFSSGAVKMARLMINPSVEDFLEITDSKGSDLELADVQIGPGNPYVGKRLAETDLRERGIMVIGIRRASGERLLPPTGNAVIQEGDSLFAFGVAGSVNALVGEPLGSSEAFPQPSSGRKS